MAHTSAVAKVFRDFADDLATERPGHLEALGRVVNGFEGWIRTEFVLWLAVARGFAIDQGDHRGDVGVEYTAKLDGRQTDLRTKRCDMWLRAAPLPSRAFHYVEFKVVFAKTNRDKMLELAAGDLQFMSQLRARHEEVASGNLVVIGSAFDSINWAVARKELAERVPHATREAGREQNGLAGGTIRWDVWTVPYEYDRR
jgi:hypothetical protein